jgi:hypothetical protein
MMKNIAFLALALAGGFIFQVVWWRIRRPSISSVLFLFALVFIGLSMTGLCLGILNLGPADYVKSLHAKIGELTLENDFLEGALTKAGLLSAKR